MMKNRIRKAKRRIKTQFDKDERAYRKRQRAVAREARRFKTECQREVLKTVNEDRVKMGLMPLPMLVKGIMGDSEECTIARSLTYGNGVIADVSGAGIRVYRGGGMREVVVRRNITKEEKELIRMFDDGDIPELVQSTDPQVD